LEAKHDIESNNDCELILHQSKIGLSKFNKPYLIDLVTIHVIIKEEMILPSAIIEDFKDFFKEKNSEATKQKEVIAQLKEKNFNVDVKNFQIKEFVFTVLDNKNDVRNDISFESLKIEIKNES